MNPRKILLVDARPESLKAYSGLLDAAGFEVTTAADAKEALESAAASEPDLILLNISKPARMDAGIVRAMQARRLPLVLIADIDETDEELRGASRVIYEPCRPRTMLEVVEDALRHRRAGPRITGEDCG